jgi:hypothetical protein
MCGHTFILIPHCVLAFQLMYDRLDEAMRDGKSRKLVSIFEIPANFTAGALERFEQGSKADQKLLDTASIDIRIDSTGKS